MKNVVKVMQNDFSSHKLYILERLNEHIMSNCQSIDTKDSFSIYIAKKKKAFSSQIRRLVYMYFTLTF